MSFRDRDRSMEPPLVYACSDGSSDNRKQGYMIERGRGNVQYPNYDGVSHGVHLLVYFGKSYCAIHVSCRTTFQAHSVLRMCSNNRGSNMTRFKCLFCFVGFVSICFTDTGAFSLLPFQTRLVYIEATLVGTSTRCGSLQRADAQMCGFAISRLHDVCRQR